MLMTISTTMHPATDLGYLLHKNPEKAHRFSQRFGTAHVFYTEANDSLCTACLLVDVDPVNLVRGKDKSSSGLLDQYVNDRPYAASSFLSVALGDAFSTALSGRCRDKPELAEQAIPLVAHLPVVPARRGGAGFLQSLFEPLGYQVDLQPIQLDEHFPEWGDSAYVSLTLTTVKRVQELLTHLYVLLPVLDNDKHYWVGNDEVEKLLKHGGDWLAHHPEKGKITRRYLRHKWSLARTALARLEVIEEDSVDEDISEESISTGNGAAAPEQVDEIVVTSSAITDEEALVEAPISLNEARQREVLAALQTAEVESVVDLGCGDGKLLTRLIRDKRFKRIVGLDVSARALEIASARLRLDRLPPRILERISLIHGALTYRDARIEGFDAATVIEVIEHLEPNRLTAFEQVLFKCARPRVAIVTTPNVEYNVKFEFLPPGKLRHNDHRFEWNRQEFQDWSFRMAEQYEYTVTLSPIGARDPEVGAPTQMAVFVRCAP